MEITLKNNLSRRRLLQLGGVAAAASVASRFGWANPLGLPIGIQLYMVAQTLEQDAPGTLKALHSMGYREVEIASLERHTPAEFRKLLNDAGLTCPSVHLKLTGDNLGPEFEAAKVLGAKYAVSSVLLELSDEFRQNAKKARAEGKALPLPKLGLAGFKKLAVKMNEVGKKAKEAGMQYAYHNHNFEFEKMPDGSPGYDVLVKETDPALVKFEVDCGWMVVAGANPANYFRRFPGRFRMLHIKDFKPVPHPTIDLMGPNRPKGTDLGTGFVQYGPIFAAAKTAGIEHLFAEQEGPFAVSQMESAKVDAEFMKKFN